MDLEDRKVVCKVCVTQFARYICPRCNLAYCSLPCYKQHSSSCTESFYRDQAVQQLKGKHADQAQKHELLALLQRAQLQREQDGLLLQQGGPDSTLAAGGHRLQGGEGGTDSDEEGSTGGEEGGSQSSGSSESGETSEGEGMTSEEEDEEEKGGRMVVTGAPSLSQHAVGVSALNAGQWAPGSQAPAAGQASTSGREQQEGGPEGQRAASSSRGHLSRATLKKIMRKLRNKDPDAVEIDESDLTPGELQAFHRALAAGRLSHLLTPWQPWWLSPEARDLVLSSSGQTLIQPATQQQQLQQVLPGPTLTRPDSRRQADSADGEVAPAQVLPDASPEPLPPVARLTRATPSPLLRWQLVELLYAYCFVQRRYNGEAVQPDNVLEAAAQVLALSPVLAAAAEPQRTQGEPTKAVGTPSPGGVSSAGVQEAATAAPASPPVAPPRPSAAAAPPASASEAVMRCLSAACQPPVGDVTARPMAVGVLADVVAVLEAGPSCVTLALTDLHRLLTRALDLITHTHQRAAASKRALKAAAGKVWFSLCWAHEQHSVAARDGSEPLAVQLAVAVGHELREVVQQAGAQRPTSDVKTRG